MPFTEHLPADLDCIELLRHCSDIGVMIIDDNLRVVDCNHGAQRMFLAGFPGALHDIACFQANQSCNGVIRPPFKGEWVDRVQQSIANKMPIVVDHVFNAQRFVTTFAPLEPEEMTSMIAMSHPGEPAIPDSKQVVRAVPSPDELGPLRVLSRRELEVFLLLGEGRRINEVSSFLHRSARTIETHRRSIGLKMGVHSLGEIIRFTTSRSLKFDVVFPN